MQRNFGARDQLKNLKNREQVGKFSSQQNHIKKKKPTSGPDPASIQKYLASKQGKNLSNREVSYNHQSSIKKKPSGPDPEAVKRYLDRKNQEGKLKEQEHFKRLSSNQNCLKKKTSSGHDAAAIKRYLSKKEQEKNSKSINQNEKPYSGQVKNLSVQDTKKKPSKLNPALQRYLERNKQERNNKEEMKAIPTQQENIGSNVLSLQRIPKKNSSESTSKAYSVKEKQNNSKDYLHSKTSIQQKCLIDKKSSDSNAFNMQKSLANKKQINSDNREIKRASLTNQQNLSRTSISKTDPSNVERSIKKKEPTQFSSSKVQVKNSSNHLNLNIKKKPKPGPDLATIQRFLARRELEKNSKTREIIKKPQFNQSVINKKQPCKPNPAVEKLISKRTNEDMKVREKQPIKKFAPIGYSYKRNIDYDDESEIDDEMKDFIDDGDDFESQKEDVSRYIKEIFGYDKDKYLYDDDDDIEEASFAQQMKEEMRSTKIGILEDLEDMRKEEEERKAKKRKKRVIDDY